MAPQQVLDPQDVSSARWPIRPPPSELPQALREFGYIPDFETWRAGDLLLFATSRPTLLQKQIHRTQRKLNYADEDARWHHAAVYIGDRYLCEARPGGVRYHPVVETIDTNTLIRIRRDRALTETEQFRLAIHALMRLSSPYWYGFVLRALFRPLNPKRFVLGLRASTQAHICSQLFHEAYMEVAGSTLMERADREVLPAELSATHKLYDVDTNWVRLPRP